MTLKISVTKRFTFEAAHLLPDHDGKCSRLHGHNYEVELTVEGPILETGSKTGMVIDFSDLNTLWKEILEPSLDHQYLNETVDADPPTAENLAVWIFQFISVELPVGTTLKSVRVWETKDCYAEVTCQT